MILGFVFFHLSLATNLCMYPASFQCFENGRDITIPEKKQEDQAVIKGTVQDEGGLALAYASVYISNTTIGAITDENGYYIIEKVPYGQHILVVSFVGYQSQKKRIQVDQPELECNFVMPEKELEIDEVLVTDRKTKNRRKQHFKTFQRYFLGTSSNAGQCSIKNPEVLRFSIEPGSRALTAIAYNNILVENRALGYRVYYLLEKFEVYRDGSSMYLGKPRYEEMEPANDEEAKTWKMKRYMAYTGSFRHFLVALVNNDFNQQGFFITRVMDTRTDSHPIEQIFSSGDIMVPGVRHFERRLRFGFILFIRFEKEPYYDPRNNRFDPLVHITQDSWIKMLKPDIIFHTNGYLYDPTSLIFFGNWADEKVAEELPFDYIPEKTVY